MLLYNCSIQSSECTLGSTIINYWLYLYMYMWLQTAFPFLIGLNNVHVYPSVVHTVYVQVMYIYLHIHWLQQCIPFCSMQIVYVPTCTCTYTYTDHHVVTCVCIIHFVVFATTHTVPPNCFH